MAQTQTSFSPRRGGALAAAVLLASLGAGAVHAQSLSDKYWLEAQLYFPSIDSNFDFSRPGQPGTEVDGESDLSLKKHETLPALYAGWRFANRWMLAGELYSLDRNGSRTLSRDLSFDGSVYPANFDIDSKLRSDVYRLSIGYAFIRRPEAELGVSLGLHATDFKFELAGQTRVNGTVTSSRVARRQEFLAPLPTIGAYGGYQFTPKLALTGRVDYLSLTVGDYGGGILNLQAALGYRVYKSVEIGAAWRYVDYNLDVDKKTYSAKIDYTFSGPSIYARVGFQ